VKGLILFWVQTESTGKVAAMVIARIKREPEGLRAGEESYVVGHVDQKGVRSFWHHKDLRTKMERPFVRVLGGPKRFWSAKYRHLLELWEYSHRRDARCGNNARWFIAVSWEGLLWYIFPAECLVGVFLVELVFSRQKSPR
jgi:hypothetical protein